MCGIAGFVHFDPSRRASSDVARSMARTLAHRGPDDEQVVAEGPVAFGHRRLSIIDLSLGNQPMNDADDLCMITFNGEIYNYRSLRAELESLGYRHRTNSDTETLLLAYLAWGIEAFPRLNGMFALVIWDRRTRTLVGARDKAGQKPLYWTVFDSTLLFASEPKAFFEYPAYRARLDLESLQEYLAYEYVPAPKTIYRSVFKLPAGCYFEWTSGSVIAEGDSNALKSRRYWAIPEVDKSISPVTAVSHVRELLSTAVERHLVADVPVGVFLSGGIDSSAVACLARRVKHEVSTFTIGFTDPTFDESRFARKAAQQFGTHHHEQLIDAEEVLELAREIDQLTDEPFGDASLIPTYLLSRFARKHVKVALGGDGADELWAGYPTYQAHRWLKLYRRLPELLRRKLVEPLISKLRVSHRNFSFDFKAKRFVLGAEFPFPLNHQTWLGSFGYAEQELLLTESVSRVSGNAALFLAALAITGNTEHPQLRHELLLDFRLYFADDILFKTDRAGMAASLEIRAPFLDTEFLDYVWTLPDSMKMTGGRTKVVLRDALRGVLPASVLSRPKKGFGIPIGKWFKGPLEPHLRSTLDDLGETGLFERDYLRKLLREHVTDQIDHRKKLWTLYALGRWMRRWNPEYSH